MEERTSRFRETRTLYSSSRFFSSASPSRADLDCQKFLYCFRRDASRSSAVMLMGLLRWESLRKGKGERFGWDSGVEGGEMKSRCREDGSWQSNVSVKAKQRGGELL